MEILADVDISPNPNPFNFWTAESEYIKKKLEYECIFLKIDLVRIHVNPFMV